jgi:hypothetical protein
MQKLECHPNIKSEDLKAIAARSANIDALASACRTIEIITGKPVTFNKGDTQSALPKKPTDAQVGGNHYQKYKIPPVEFFMKNNVPYVEGNVIKYVMRFRDKNGLEDLLKARQYLNILIAAEYPNHKLND